MELTHFWNVCEKWCTQSLRNKWNLSSPIICFVSRLNVLPKHWPSFFFRNPGILKSLKSIQWFLESISWIEKNYFESIFEDPESIICRHFNGKSIIRVSYRVKIDYSDVTQGENRFLVLRKRFFVLKIDYLMCKFVKKRPAGAHMNIFWNLEKSIQISFFLANKSFSLNR